MMNYIKENSEWLLADVYKTDVVKGYYDSEAYFKKFGKKGDFETSRPYHYWIECSTSKIYKEQLELIIQKWKDDIMIGYNVYMEEAIDMEDDEEVKEKLINYNNNYDNTFEYICKQFDDGYYYSSPNYCYVYDVLNR